MEKRQSYKQRLKIPIDNPSNIPLYTKSGLKLSNGSTRVVIGGRGPYVEFSTEQLVLSNISIPKDKLHKLRNTQSYYHEYRTNDKCYVKVYFQMIGVQYADYKAGYWYVDPELLFLEDGSKIIGPLYKDDKDDKDDKNDPEKTLFD